MARIFGLGETVLDIVFKDGRPVSSQPGGSAFNALISLARAGHHVELISEIGVDSVGNRIMRFLEDNGVGTRWIHRFSTGKTPVALAFLDKDNNARYQVYKDFPDDRFQIEAPDFKSGDILLFGSFFSVNPVLRSKVKELLTLAKNSGVYLIYDPNFRKNHIDGIEIYRPIIEENFSIAHLVRGSDEDFETIYGGITIDEVLSKIQSFGADAIVTANAHGVYALIQNNFYFIAAEPIEPVSTIGAGDNFNAGLAHGLVKQHRLPNNSDEWKAIIKGAVAFSTEVCLSMDNYISNDFAAIL